MHRDTLPLAVQRGHGMVLPASPLLQRLDRISPLSAEEREALTALEGRPIAYPKGHDIVRPHDPSSLPFVIHSGFVIVARYNRTGDRMIIDLLVPGEIGNARAMVLGQSDMYYTALGDAVATQIPEEIYNKLLLAHPKRLMALMWMGAISRSLLAERLYSLGRRNGYQRIGHFLLELHTRLANVGLTDRTSFRAPLTLAVLGDLLGLTPEHVSRLLQRLRRDGLIATDRDRWNLLDIPRMAAACDFDPRYLHLLAVSHAGDAPG